MKSNRLFTIIFIVCLVAGIAACSSPQSNPTSVSQPNPTSVPQANPPKSSSEQLELALSSIRRVKIRFDAQATKNGQGNELVSGLAQFESGSDNSKPLSYISTDQVSFFLSESNAAVRYGTGKWEGIPLADSFINTITSIPKGIPDILTQDVFAATGLRLTSSSLDSSWQSFGTTALDGKQVYSFQKESTATNVWNLFFGLLSGNSVKKTLTELWVGTDTNLPYRIRYTFYLVSPQSSGGSNFEINLYPYDYNEPLNLPGDLPQ